METYKIKSSWMGSEVTYLPTSKRLCIIIGASKYFYYGVSRIRLNKFLKAPSKGRYFVQHIKGQYRSLKRAL